MQNEAKSGEKITVHHGHFGEQLGARVPREVFDRLARDAEARYWSGREMRDWLQDNDDEWMGVFEAAGWRFHGAAKVLRELGYEVTEGGMK